MNHPINDPYANCESGRCTHELARAVTIDELLTSEGPHRPTSTIVNLAAARPTLFDMEEPVDVRRAG